MKRSLQTVADGGAALDKQDPPRRQRLSRAAAPKPGSLNVKKAAAKATETLRARKQEAARYYLEEQAKGNDISLVIAAAKYDLHASQKGAVDYHVRQYKRTDLQANHLFHQHLEQLRAQRGQKEKATRRKKKAPAADGEVIVTEGTHAQRFTAAYKWAGVRYNMGGGGYRQVASEANKRFDLVQSNGQPWGDGRRAMSKHTVMVSANAGGQIDPPTPGRPGWIPAEAEKKLFSIILYMDVVNCPIGQKELMTMAGSIIRTCPVHSACRNIISHLRVTANVPRL